MTTTFLRVAVALCVPLSAFAQESPKVGIVMGLPASVGIIVPLSSGVALRPEIGFSTASLESPLSETEASTISPGISVLLYFGKDEAVRPYISPRYVYRHSSSSSSALLLSSESASTSHEISGSFGVQFDAHRRFSVFGEVGLAFSTSSVELEGLSDFLSEEPSANALSLRTAVGVVFRF